MEREAGSETAIRCFAENTSHFADSKKEPEKFNLYKGLWHLARAISDIELTLGSMGERLNAIDQQLNSLERKAR